MCVAPLVVGSGGRLWRSVHACFGCAVSAPCLSAKLRCSRLTEEFAMWLSCENLLMKLCLSVNKIKTSTPEHANSAIIRHDKAPRSQISAAIAIQKRLCGHSQFPLDGELCVLRFALFEDVLIVSPSIRRLRFAHTAVKHR